jgi:hypothetical protein
MPTHSAENHVTHFITLIKKSSALLLIHNSNYFQEIPTFSPKDHVTIQTDNKTTLLLSICFCPLFLYWHYNTTIFCD